MLRDPIPSQRDQVVKRLVKLVTRKNTSIRSNLDLIGNITNKMKITANEISLTIPKSRNVL